MSSFMLATKFGAREILSRQLEPRDFFSTCKQTFCRSNGQDANMALMDTRKKDGMVIADLSLPANIKDIIHKKGCDTLDDLVSSDPAVLTKTKGFGAGARRELELALAALLPTLESPVADQAVKFIDELRLKPKTNESKCPVEDVRALTWAFENLKHKPSVRIMRCRLALDGGPRPKVKEVASQLGVTKNAVTLADFKVTDWLRTSDAFVVAHDWLNWVLSHSVGYVTYQELEELFDTRVASEPGDLLTALRLLERVEGRICSWTLEFDGFVVDREFLATVKETRERLARHSQPVSPTQVAEAITQDIGRTMSEPTALQVAQRIWLDQVTENGVTVRTQKKTKKKTRKKKS